MAVTSLASFKGAREKEKKKYTRQFKRSRPRSLGGKDIHFAMDTYCCCRCIFHIMPGDEYRRERYVRSYETTKGEKASFYNERHHLPQCYGPSEEEDRKMREEIERERERERQEDVAKKAA